MSTKLIALADGEAMGFPWSRRTTDRLRKNDPDFPRVIEMSGRLYVDHNELEAYHAILRQRGAGKAGRKPGAVQNVDRSSSAVAA